MKNIINKYFQAILSAYENNIFYLPLPKAGHFFERAYKITGNKKYENIIAYHLFIDKIGSVKKSLLAIKKKNFKAKKRKSPKKLSERKEKRHLLYKKYPAVNFFNNLFIGLFFSKMFSLHKTVLKKEFEGIKKRLQKIDFEDIYIKEDVIKYDSSYTFNSAFILKHLGICKINKKIENFLKKMYFTPKLELKKELPNFEFSSLMYSMTHIIIADSKYYERYVSDHEWIIDYFAKNVDRIIKKVSLDILAEIGLCFKLCKKTKKYQKEFNKITNRLLKKVSLKKLKNVNFLVEKEHTNSILMLLFADNKKFFKCPDLSKHKIFKN